MGIYNYFVKLLSPFFHFSERSQEQPINSPVREGDSGIKVPYCLPPFPAYLWRNHLSGRGRSRVHRNQHHHGRHSSQETAAANFTLNQVHLPRRRISGVRALEGKDLGRGHSRAAVNILRITKMLAATLKCYELAVLVKEQNIKLSLCKTENNLYAGSARIITTDTTLVNWCHDFISTVKNNDKLAFYTFFGKVVISFLSGSFKKFFMDFGELTGDHECSVWIKFMELLESFEQAVR